MKRAICWILIAALMLGFLGMLGLEVFAAPVGTVSSLTFQVANMIPGKEIPAVPEVTLVDEGYSYRAYWGSRWQDPTTDTVFQEDVDYCFTVEVTAPEGVTFDENNFHWNVQGTYWGLWYDIMDDGKVAYIEITAEPKYNIIEEVTFDKLPESIAPGAAPETQVQASGNCSVASVQWLDESMENVVTAFEDKHSYYLKVELKAADSYAFCWETYTSSQNGKYPEKTWWEGVYDQEFVAYFRYSLEEQVTWFTLEGNKPKAGMNIKDLIATVKDGNAQVGEIRIQEYDYDVYQYTLVTEGTFKENKFYNIVYVVKPLDSYEFGSFCHGEFADNRPVSYSRENPNTYKLYYNYSTYPKIDKVELSMTQLTEGMKLSNVKLTAPEGAKYTVESYEFFEFWGSGETLDLSKRYSLNYTITADRGYAFDEETLVTINGEPAGNYISSGGQKIWDDKEFTMTMPYVFLGGLPYKITAGSATVPVVEVSSPEYRVTSAKWVDSSNKTVTSFKEGKTYKFVMEVETYNGRVFTENTEFWVNNGYFKGDVKRTGKYNATVSVEFTAGGAVAVTKLAKPKVSVSGETLSWEGVGANAYEIYRATSKSGKYALVDTVTDLSWQDEAVPGKTFYYKVKAISTADSNKNSDFSNIVSVAYKLPAVNASVAIDEDLGKATLSWEGVEGAKSYEIWRATSEDGKYTRVATVKASQVATYARAAGYVYVDKSASVGKQYFYKVRAVAASSAYNSPDSNKVSAVAVCARAKLTAKMDTATGKPVISWAKVDGAANYWLLRRVAGSNLSYDVISRQTALTYTDKTAQVDVEYEYIMQVIGKDEALDSVMSQPVFAVCGLAKPVVKGAITDQGKPQLSWEAVEGAVKYEVYRSTKSNKGFTLLGEINSTMVDDMSVATGKTYYYQVIAVGENGKSVASSYVKLTGKCAAPMIYVENAQNGKPLVSWGKIEGAKQYTVYRATSENGKYSKAGTTKNLYYNDTKASAGKTYFYKVIANASKSSYNSIYSNVSSCNVICSAPTVTVKIDAATGKPSLSWKKVDLAAGYRIYRQLPGQEFEVIAEVTTLSFKDETAPIDTLCVYRVQTIGKGEGLDSNLKEVSATTGLAKPVVTAYPDAEGDPVLEWEAVEGAVKYEIYRSTKSTKGFVLLGVEEQDNFPFYQDKAVKTGQTFYYQVIAVGKNGKSVASATLKYTGKCAAPSVNIGTSASGKVLLTWKPVADAKQYTVYRCTLEFGTYTKIGTTKTTSFEDKKATEGKIYYYKVVANGPKSGSDSDFSIQRKGYAICATPDVKVTYNAQGQPTISWSKVSGATKYKILYQVGFMGGREPEVQEVYTTSTSYAFQDLSTGMLGYVQVIAVAADESCNSQAGEAEFTVLPATPVVSGKVGASGKPVLTWNHVSDTITYEVYRSTKSGSGYKLIGQVDLMGEDSEPAEIQTYEDTTAAKGKTYYYKVVAKGWQGESEMSSSVKVKATK